MINNEVREAINRSLSFSLTKDQINVFEEIVRDLKSPYAMQRLVQGDVGCGKTVIAFLILLLAKMNGLQAAFLAPTEILINQHFHKAKGFFKYATLEILSGSIPPKKKSEIRKRLKEGKIDIIFGTHALLNEKIEFKNLALIIIDEQHRFGVSQRATIYYKGRGVDLLVMTATPIPRTMLLTVYKDLSVSTIKLKPPGLKPVITKIIRPERRDQFYKFLRVKIEEGNKAFIVLPLIERSEFFPEMFSLEDESEYFRINFKPFKVGLISSKTPQIKKEMIFNDFVTGRINILVSTTVIEVGVDVKDATIIVIENADRYGLAQLHQLRGRVGRDKYQSYCYLLYSKGISENGKKRLKTIASSNDGFRIAEDDLKMRGGGMIAGFEQSGYVGFKTADISTDYNIFISAQDDALNILKAKQLQNKFISDWLASIDTKIKKINIS